jgi:hypothetical protein
MSLSKYVFREKRYSESHTLRLAVNEMLPIFGSLLSGLNKIRYVKPHCEFYENYFKENPPLINGVK